MWTWPVMCHTCRRFSAGPNVNAHPQVRAALTAFLTGNDDTTVREMRDALMNAISAKGMHSAFVVFLF